MASRESIEKGVNAVLILGLLVLVLGIGLWMANLLQSVHASAEAMLIVFGLLLLILGAFAAKLFTKVGN
jgi:hypothetical protein